MADKDVLAYHIRYLHVLQAPRPMKRPKQTSRLPEAQRKPLSSKHAKGLISSGVVAVAMQDFAKAQERLDIQDASDSLSFEPSPRAVGKRKRGRPTKRVVMVHAETGRVISGKHAPKREVSLCFSVKENYKNNILQGNYSYYWTLFIARSCF